LNRSVVAVPIVGGVVATAEAIVVACARAAPGCECGNAMIE
jgi:hypothetical protein